MNRRSAISSYLVLTAGVLIFPGCLEEKKKSSVAFRNFEITDDQELLMDDLTETIVPKTNTPGAKDISSHFFSLMMVDDCFDPDSQKKFINGLNQFESAAKDRFGNSFSKSSPEQKISFLGSIENKTGVSEDILFFYQSVKRLTIESFVQSKYFLTNIHKYELIPGRFHGCYPVAKAE